MATVKKFVPLSPPDAAEFVDSHFPGLSDEMTISECVIYAEMVRLHERLDGIENQAEEMMSPEKMMEMAQGFLGVKL